MIKRISTLALLLILLCSVPAFANGSRSGRSRRVPIPRVQYSSSKHTVEHGGSYPGGAPVTHKGGHYENAKTNDRYGRHKRY